MLDIKKDYWNPLHATAHGTGEDGKNTWRIAVEGRTVVTGTKDECTLFLCLVKKYKNVKRAEQEYNDRCTQTTQSQAPKSFGSSLNIRI